MHKLNGKLCTLFVRNVWFWRKIDCLELRKFNGKLCTLYVRNVWICRKIEYPELQKLNGKLWTLYVRNDWICREIYCLELHKFNGNLCTLYVWNVWICREIYCLKMHKFNGKLCTLYMYGMVGFAEKLNVQNCGNSTGNCVHYICKECLDLQKIFNIQNSKNSTEFVYIIYVRNGWICRKIDCPILRKFNGKLYTLYVRNVWICRETEYPELRKFKGKFCTIFMYDMSRFAEKLNVQNCINSTENCVHYICTKCLDLQKNWLSRTA